jgi:ribosomal protein L11 methyltransferase
VPSGVVLRCSFPTDAAAREAATALGEGLAVEVADVADEEWRDEWKRHAEAVDVGDRLRVVPAWKPDHEIGGRLSLRLDSGACFGSGSHPTTRMVLAELERVVRPGATVLDVGTGSGVLAVAAARLGAREVDAIDIDPAAVDVTAANAQGNGVGGVVTASTTPLAGVAGRYDVVLANVSAATLADLATDLDRVAGPDGTLVLSGMLAGQWRHVAPCLPGWRAVRVVEAEGWTSVVLSRTAAD